ncbi:hypothetical protein F5883DRAFT_635943 [Diaporthe sp. PMI_573]|nr:hypothetical protein F5883DRAFT_635943 [Diaporthaceae sp. PMI_573]
MADNNYHGVDPQAGMLSMLAIITPEYFLMSMFCIFFGSKVVGSRLVIPKSFKSVSPSSSTGSTGSDFFQSQHAPDPPPSVDHGFNPDREAKGDIVFSTDKYCAPQEARDPLFLVLILFETPDDTIILSIVAEELPEPCRLAYSWCENPNLVRLLQKE